MKKILFAMLSSLLVVGIAACGAPSATLTNSPALPPSATAAPAVVTFADPVLEAMVRASMGKPEGGITVADAQAVTRLSLRNEWQRYISEEAVISDIDGLQSFSNLESLDLSFHAITDITPLSGLKKLTALSLGGNPIEDIAPLAGLTSLKMLTLSGCAAQDYSPLSKLVNLQVLMLDDSALSDVSPLVPLTSLKQLYLAGCPVSDYFPLSDLYQGLEQKDFTIAFTLAEFGFTMDYGIKQAIYDSEIASVRINHTEWGVPPDGWAENCIRTVFEQNGYKIDIGYYPEHDAYVMLASGDGGLPINYVYNHADGSFTFGAGDRASTEQTMRMMFPDADAQDILLAPVQIFHDFITQILGISADTLFEMPFEPQTLNSMGFVPDAGGAVRVYWQQEPHHMHISIYKPEWGAKPEGFNPEGCDVEFFDSDVNGYGLLILYFANEGTYRISLFKDGVDSAFVISAATDEYGEEYPDVDTVHQMFGAAFGTSGEGLYHEPLTYFEQLIEELFGMNIDELIALPQG